MMPRYCLLGHVDPNRLDEYREAHRAVWPELLEALRDAGWRNYSLFLRDDGSADRLRRGRRSGGRAGTGGAYRESMLAGRRRCAELFQTDGAPDEAWEIVPEVFNLEDQLRSARADS